MGDKYFNSFYELSITSRYCLNSWLFIRKIMHSFTTIDFSGGSILIHGKIVFDDLNQSIFPCHKGQ